MPTVNLRLHHWIIIQYPHLPANFIWYNDKTPFKNTKLACDVLDFDALKQNMENSLIFLDNGPVITL